MTSPHLLVAGAGIAGLTTALALGRKGIRVTLIERRTAFEEAGAGLQLSPNASRILIELGLSGALVRDAVAPERLDIRNWTRPRAFASMPMGDAAESFGAPFWVTRRADLQTALLDAVRQLPDLRLMAGRTLEDVATGPTGTTVTVLNERGQRESLDADGLIGADGLWSQVRQHTGDGQMPVFTGFEAWRALVPSERVPAFLRQPAVALWLGAAKHAVSYPVAGSRLVNLVVIRRAGSARQGWSNAAEAGDLAGTMADAAAPLRDLIAAAPGWQVWSLHDRLPAAMAKGTIALVGDAAHPILPFMAQGAALAIEDAAVLARALAAGYAAGQPLSGAFKVYADARSMRARRLHATARDNASHYHLSWPWSLARDLVLRRSSPERLLARYRWIYGWRDG